MIFEEKIIKETNKIWGEEYMTGLCMEEFAEVIQAISKIRREGGSSNNCDHLNEEIADCLICIEQLKDMGYCDKERIQWWIHQKQDRQVERNSLKRGHS